MRIKISLSRITRGDGPNSLQDEVNAMLKRVAKAKAVALRAIKELWDKAVSVVAKAKRGMNEPGQHALTIQVFQNLVELKYR
jgi:hypothetical protein